MEYRDSDVRYSELETGLSSSGESFDKDFEIVVSKPLLSSKPSSSSKVPSSSIPFHAPSESCLLESRHLKSIRKRFQFPEGIAIRLPLPNEKACTFAHDEVSFYESTFSYGLRFPVHPFIMQLLFALNVAPGQLVPNTWRTIIGCMLIWVSIHDGDTITLNEFLYLYCLQPSTHYGYFELLPWNRESRIVRRFPTSFCDWKSWYFFISGFGWETMSNDLWGEVSWLLRKLEIPSLGVFLYLSIRPIVLASLFLILLLS